MELKKNSIKVCFPPRDVWWKTFKKNQRMAIIHYLDYYTKEYYEWHYEYLDKNCNTIINRELRDPQEKLQC